MILSRYGAAQYTKTQGVKIIDIYTYDRVFNSKVLCENYQVTYLDNVLEDVQNISDISIGLNERCMNFAKEARDDSEAENTDIGANSSRADVIYILGTPTYIDSENNYSYELVKKYENIFSCKDIKISFSGDIVKTISNISDTSTNEKCQVLANTYRKEQEQKKLIATIAIIGAVAIIAAQGSGGSAPAKPIYDGKCKCPDDIANDGSRCGARSAYSRKGGSAPICY